jgi:hypothetical protein
MYMEKEDVLIKWRWRVTRVAIYGMLATYSICFIVILVVVSTKHLSRVSIQDGSPQACFAITK